MSLPEEPVSESAPFFIVMNAGSGDQDAEATETAVREVLSRAGHPHRIWRVAEGEALSEAARQAVGLARQQHGVVVAAGGDGTINTVAQAVLEGDCLFGVLPRGTFNYFSRTHGIPVDVVAATRILIDGVVRPVQAGLVNDRVFLVNASLGLYPKLLENREADKQQFGRTRTVALISALRTLFTLPRPLVLTLEEAGASETMKVATLVVENNALQLQEVGLPEAGEVQRGRLAAVAVRATGKLQMLSLLARAALGTLGAAEKITSFAFQSLTVTPLRKTPIKVATDGEVAWMVPPLLFRVAPRPLRLLVPRCSETGEAS